jgi:RNA exonuclease 1
LFDKDYLSTIPNKEIENKLWLESNIILKTQSIVAVDCEMCGIEGNKSILSRLTIVDQYSKILLDVYIQPDQDTPIIDYRTVWSGISKKTLENVTVTQNQARLAFLRLVSSETILIGHSLENDLKALKILHRTCIDTSIIYPHTKGYPLRLKLKKLAETYLSLKIQNGGSRGHDSAEDARVAMQLVNLKVERGPLFGIKSPQKVRDLVDLFNIKTYIIIFQLIISLLFNIYFY